MHISPTSCLLALLQLHGHWEITFSQLQLTNIINALFGLTHAESTQWSNGICKHACASMHVHSGQSFDSGPSLHSIDHMCS